MEVDGLSYSSEQSKSRILACAQQEFLDNGFEKANLRRIADDAHVTTGALYNYFSGKDALFDALVADTAEEFFTQFRARREAAARTLAAGETTVRSDFQKGGSEWTVEYIYRHFPTMKLLLCCAGGTKWENYLERFTALEESAHKKYFQEVTPPLEIPSDFFFHCTAAAGFQFLAHIVEHDLSRDEALRAMEEEDRFRAAGWRELMGQ